MKLLVLLINRRQASVKCQGKPRATDAAAPNPKTRSCQFFGCIGTEELVNKIRWGKQCKVFRVYFLTRHSWATSLCHQNELNLVVLSFKGGRFMRMMRGVRMALFIFGTIPRWLDSSSIPFNNLNGQQGNKPTTSLPQNCTLFENHSNSHIYNFASEASYFFIPG